MTTTEAKTIFEQASQLLKNNPDDDKIQRDAIGLFLVAIDKAGGSFPEADAEIAWLYFSLRDEFNARRYADYALNSDPNLFIARYVKFGYAFKDLPGFFAKIKFQSERKELLLIFENMCKQGVSSEDFVLYANLLMTLSDKAESIGAFSARGVYETITSVPINKLAYENDDDKANVEKIRLIAQGRLRI